MPNYVSVPTDDLAFACRDQLDYAQDYLVAAALPINHVKGVLAAAKAEFVAELALHYIHPGHVDDKERFEVLHNEARKVLQAYWKAFKLYPIRGENGAVTGAIQVVEPPKPIVAQPKPEAPLVRSKDALSAGVTRRRRLNPRARMLKEDDYVIIRKYFADIRAERKVTNQDFVECAAMYEKSPATIYNIVMGYGSYKKK